MPHIHVHVERVENESTLIEQTRDFAIFSLHRFSVSYASFPLVTLPFVLTSLLDIIILSHTHSISSTRTRGIRIRKKINL